MYAASTSDAFPLGRTMMLDGLMSRCTMGGTLLGQWRE
jgi:hypothetical protein